METEEMQVEEVQEKPRNPMTFSIDELGFTLRTNNCLKRHGVKTIGELCNMTENEVKSVRNLGSNSLEEIKTKLAEHGVSLAKIERFKARNTLDGISAGKHRQVVEALKVINQYCASTFNNINGCDNCVFCPTDDGQRCCPLRGDFTPIMFLDWSRRADKLDVRGNEHENNSRTFR